MCDDDPSYTTYGTTGGGFAQALGNAAKGRKPRPLGLLAAAKRKPAPMPQPKKRGR